MVGEGFNVSTQLRISSSSSPANSCEYGISGVDTLVGGRGLSLVRPTFSSIGEAMTLCSDEEGGNGGWLNLSICPCATSMVVRLVCGDLSTTIRLKVGLFSLLEVELLVLLEEVGLGLFSSSV